LIISSFSILYALASQKLLVTNGEGAAHGRADERRQMSAL